MAAEEITITLTVLALGVAYNMYLWKKEKQRPARIAVIEDNNEDYMLLTGFFNMNNVIFDRYKTGDNLPMLFAANKPDLVIADYYLEGHIRGDEIIKLCDKLRIKSRLVTGYEGAIMGVDPARIVRKSQDNTHIETLRSWAQHQLA